MTIQLSDRFTFVKLLRFTIPTIIMLIFTSVYNVVDGFFVSNYVGKTSFSAVNFIIPLARSALCLEREAVRLLPRQWEKATRKNPVFLSYEAIYYRRRIYTSRQYQCLLKILFYFYICYQGLFVITFSRYFFCNFAYCDIIIYLYLACK